MMNVATKTMMNAKASKMLLKIEMTSSKPSAFSSSRTSEVMTSTPEPRAAWMSACTDAMSAPVSTITLIWS